MTNSSSAPASAPQASWVDAWTAIGGVASVVAFVFVIGATIEAVRLHHAGVPVEEALAVVPRASMVALAINALFLPTLVTTVIVVLMVAFFRHAEDRRERPENVARRRVGGLRKGVGNVVERTLDDGQVAATVDQALRKQIREAAESRMKELGIDGLDETATEELIAEIERATIGPLRGEMTGRVSSHLRDVLGGSIAKASEGLSETDLQSVNAAIDEAAERALDPDSRLTARIVRSFRRGRRRLLQRLLTLFRPSARVLLWPLRRFGGYWLILLAIAGYLFIPVTTALLLGYPILWGQVWAQSSVFQAGRAHRISRRRELALLGLVSAIAVGLNSLLGELVDPGPLPLASVEVYGRTGALTGDFIGNDLTGVYVGRKGRLITIPQRLTEQVNITPAPPQKPEVSRSLFQRLT
jgi:hypothetical protein